MEKGKINVILEYMDSIKKSFLEAQQVLADFRGGRGEIETSWVGGRDIIPGIEKRR